MGSGSRLLIILLGCVLTIEFTSGRQITGCGGKPADVVFVLDASSSIWGPNFRKQMKFVRSVVQDFDVSPTNTRCGLLTFSDYVREEFDLSTHYDKEDTLRGMRRVVQTLGGTRTDEALLRMREMMTRQGRQEVPRLAIVMTDGESEHPELTDAQAKLAHQQGITVFAVGIGDRVNTAELDAIASKPEYVFTVDTFDALKTIRTILALSACQVQNDAPASYNEVNKVTPPTRGCDGKPADVVFMLDSSGSIWGPDFTRQLSFIQDIVGIFQVSPKATRIGVLTFSDSPEPQFHLDRFEKEADIKEAVSRIRQSGGNTNTADALHSLRNTFFSADHSRDGVVHIGVIITDGKSDIPDETKREAEAAKNQGIHIFAIGVGSKVDRKELYNIASSPPKEYIFMVDDYEALNSIKLLLAMKTCEITTTPSPTTTTTTTTTTTPAPPRECGSRRPADVIFSLPTHAQSEDTNEAVRFVQSVSGQMNLGKEGVHVGIVPRACNNVEGLELRDGTDQETVTRKLASERHLPADTATVIKHVRDVSFRAGNGAREGAKKMAIFIVDKDSEESRETALEAWKCRNEDDIELFVIGVGEDVSDGELRNIASLPVHRHMFSVRSFQELQVLKEQLVSEMNDACAR